MFKKWFSKGEASLAYPLTSVTDFSLVWDSKHNLPIPDWAACEPSETISHDEKNQHWSTVAASWLGKLSVSFSEPLKLQESANFFALSALTARETEVLLDYA